MRVRWWGALVVFGVLLGTVESGHADTPERMVRDKAKILFQEHRKARRALIQTSRHPAFAEYFSGTHEPAYRERLKSMIDEAALRTQSFFDVEEMCLIDRKGHEISRVEHGHISDELADNEADMPFFEPGFALPREASLVSPIYLSEDAKGWVIAYVTPIYHDDEAVALLHYEHPLDQLQSEVIAGIDSARQFIVAVNQEGWVIIDSRTPLNYAQVPTKGRGEDYFATEIFPGLAPEEVMARIDRGQSAAGYRGAYHRISQWTLLAFERDE